MLVLLSQIVDGASSVVAQHALTLDPLTKLAAGVSSVVVGSYATWTKGLRPAYRAARAFVQRADSALALVEHELKPNGGGSLRDIVTTTRTEVRAIGNAQAVTTAMQRSQAAASRAPIFQTDATGRCEWVNDTWSRATGIALDEAMGGGWVNGIHPDDRVRVVAEWRDAVAEQRTFRSDFRYRHVSTLDETRVRTEAHPICTSDRTLVGYVGTVVLLDLVGREPFGEYDRRRAVSPLPLPPFLQASRTL